MNLEDKVRKGHYDEAVGTLIALCRIHKLKIIRHTDNYICITDICVLSEYAIDIGLSYEMLCNERTKIERFYLNKEDYEIFEKL